MKIVILAMDDPLYTNDFIKEIIDNRKSDVISYIYVTKGNRLSVGKRRSKFKYLISLFLIMGIYHFFKNSLITLIHKITKKFSKLNLCKDPTVYGYSKNLGIEVKKTENPNSKQTCNYLESIKPDVIINQSQSFIKKRLLSIPQIGVINRHNALLPKNRGRLTPFWVLYKQETETGVSIHFVEEGIDSGDIIVQKRFPVSKKDTFNSLVKKNYQIAGKAMLEALNILEDGNYKLITNSDNDATYNTIPTLMEAWQYRKRRLLDKLI